MSNRPTNKEYGEWYADYVSRVPEEDIVAALEASTKYTTDVLESFTDEQAATLQGTTKWTLKEVLGHLCDGERVFAYRAMRISRGDKTPLPGFEQDDFVANGNFGARDWSSLINEYTFLRQATIELAKSMTPEMLTQMGTAGDNPVSARALLYVIVGHERLHMEWIRQRAR
jgi:hypothetical protein